MKLSDVLSQVIELAKKANAARAQQTRAAMSPPVPEETALRQFLETQSPETVYMLTAVMCLGRRDFDVAKLFFNYALMGERFGEPERAAGQMADTTSLPQFLEDGWRTAADANIDLDAMVNTKTA